MISDDCEDPDGAAAELDGVDGVLIPGGFGVRGIEGKIGAIRYAREHGIPTLGLCLGLQCMVIEVARDLAGLAEADSAEFDPDTPHPVIATMADQDDVVAGERDMGGTMRLGLYPAALQPGTRVAGGVRRARWWRSGTGTGTRSTTPTGACSSRRAWSSPGSRRTGTWWSSSSSPEHPFFVGTQAHPEFRSRPTRPHPLFSGLIAAALARVQGGQRGRARRRQRMNIDGRASALARRLNGRAGPRPAGHRADRQGPDARR